MTMVNKSNRQLNIEILRIFSMLLITVWHIRVHFIEALHLEPSLSKTFMDYVVSFISFHVDLFILITGYFGIKNSKKGLLKTLSLIYFYSITLNAVLWIVSGEFNLLETLTPLGNNTWWFMTMYTVMLMIAPIIENYICGCDNKGIYLLVAGGLFVNLYLGYFNHVGGIYNSSSGMVNFICMYLLGVYIRKEGENLMQALPPPHGRILLIATILIVVALQYKLMPYMTWPQMTEYCAPYPIVMSVLVFLLFLSVNIPECFRKPILFLSSSAIAVYLITDHAAIRNMLSKLFAEWYLPYQNSIYGILIIISFTFIAYICSCIIDKFRIPVTDFLNRRLSRLLNIR